MDEITRNRLSRRKFLGASLTTLAGLAAYGCAPAAGPSATTAPAPSTGGAAAPTAVARSGPKTIGLATGNGIFKGIPDVQGIGATNQPEGANIAHTALSVMDHDGVPRPMLAAQLPSLTDGTWVVNPDGTMAVTWKLRRDVKWHDGRPFTSRDVRFSWELAQDNSIPMTKRPAHTNVTAIDLPDDYTAVMHWKIPNTYAHVFTTTDLTIYPEHIVRPLWETGQGERILSNEFFHGGFVGLGPYKLEKLAEDNTFFYRAFDDYFLGRPKIDTISFYQYEGSQGVLTALLSGRIQMASAYGLTFDDGQTVQQQWESTGEGKVYWTPVSLQRLFMQPDNPLFQDARVRKALLLSVDRDEINHTLFNNSVFIAHSLLHPNEPGYKEADPIITKYGFDPRQALAMFEAAGWTRASDGVLTNAAGDKFEITYRVAASNQEHQHVQSAMANFWKDVGVRTTIDNVASSVYNDATEQANYRGVSILGGSTTVAALYRRWHSTFIPTAANHYLGDNTSRWNNPQADRLLDQIEASFDQTQKNQLLAQIAKVYTDEMPALPLYYQAEPVAVHKSLLNARPRPNSSGQNTTTWDCYQWDLA
ncbi:MAG: peptide/nickel transport system substrate-binding protein [Chloroflexota bacterium]|jgi:peptide/nickel transport system substrate-binding protein|nr:peptide/nickel transport system substrate-binding protein [Chloroflexota bacterium]